MQAGPTPVSYPGQYSYQDQTVSTSPAVTYLQTQPVATAPPPSGQTPTGGPPPPPGATPPNLGGTPPAGGPPPPNLNGYAYPPTQAPYNYESVPGLVTGTRSYGMPSRINNVVKMIQPFYSDSASVDKARTFWDAFDRATEGLEDALRLSAFRECLKGNAGEQWWMYSQINDFETLRTRFHDQFVCQTPLQMIERLKSTKRSKGMSAEVWGDLISSLCYAAQCYDAEMRYQYFLSGLRNKVWKAALATTIVNSIPHAVAVLLFKNMHLPIEDDSEFAEDSSLDEKEYYDDEADYYYEGGFEEDAMPYETVVSIPSNGYYDDDAACDKESTPEPDHDCEMKTGAESCMLQAASETACNKMSTPEPDHEYETNPEVDACRMQAASVMTACDEASTPEPEHDYDKNAEAEACMLQAASVMTACDKVSTPVYDQDYEEKLEVDACAQRVTPLNNRARHGVRAGARPRL
ncbi:hypothetical protein PF010_g11021 [Phytophthora fragariae]|uniref:Retrotransposon gag domain-containing protein n=1 Tax=Phytophthora fragariae TaxID=53985 RepID=A0A6G0L6V3_9STRA|nr:hypothetical protein PF010_g11021 [Phytophthora fragariae]